ncbi:hypothetical protein GCM10022419_015860 [Nonomuraea rosea]|uniref:Uncharacterized protein n=1 Tax=Nonomuraea rosea TaxID=638574 RepID=A0ABP6VN77_9ACTN
MRSFAYVSLALSIALNFAFGAAMTVRALGAEVLSAVTSGGAAFVAVATLGLAIIHLMGGFEKQP